jgi:hypothetical protein
VIRSTVRDEGVIGRGPEALVDLLAGLDIAAWHGLHVCPCVAGHRRDRDGAAVRAPGDRARAHALARVYLETVWPGGRRAA